MNRILTDSSIHPSPAHAQSPVDVPTRYRTSEESGVQKDQNNIQSMTALLCKEVRVDTPETNSLCCAAAAAAGIIAPSSSITEVLTPHEKLRGAATPNAALIAQNSPPAQPVLGYKQGGRDEAWESCVEYLEGPEE